MPDTCEIKANKEHWIRIFPSKPAAIKNRLTAELTPVKNLALDQNTNGIHLFVSPIFVESSDSDIKKLVANAVPESTKKKKSAKCLRAVQLRYEN